MRALRSELPEVNVPNFFAALDTPTFRCSLGYFPPTTIHKFSQIACHVDAKSCSLDPLPSSLFTSNIHFLLPVLHNIVNVSLETSHFPRSLKPAVLSLLLKKPSLNHELVRNFQPISNLKVIAKIVEKVVASRLVHYLELNHLDEPLQSAYKRLHSCETALVRVHNDFNHKNYNFLNFDWFKKLPFPTNSLAKLYRTVFYWTVQQTNHIQSCSLNQPIAFKVVV